MPINRTVIPSAGLILADNIDTSLKPVPTLVKRYQLQSNDHQEILILCHNKTKLLDLITCTCTSAQINQSKSQVDTSMSEDALCRR